MIFIEGTPAHLEIFMPLIRDFYAYDEHEFEEGHIRRTMTDFLSHPDYGRAWLMQIGEEAIGYAIITFGYSLEFGGRDAFIDEIYLAENYRGQGLGQQAIEFLLATGKALGIRALHLEVMPHNTRAHAFYLRVGFENRGQLMSQYIE